MGENGHGTPDGPDFLLSAPMYLLSTPWIEVPVNCCSVSLSQQLGTPSFEVQTPRHVPSPWPAGVAGPV